MSSLSTGGCAKGSLRPLALLALSLLGCGEDASSSESGGDDASSSASGGGGGGATATGTSTGTSTSGPGATSTVTASAGSGGDTGWWQAPSGTSWQIQYVDYPLDRSFDVAVYDVDLVEVSDADLAALHEEGRIVLCYFSAGTWEPYRPDADGFPEDVLGNAYDDPAFADERYLDVRSDLVRDLMKARMDLAATRGCDGVDPDNMNLDEVGEDITGVPIGPEEQLDYSRFIATEAHARSLSVGLKNSIEHAAELEPYFDWAVNEQCWEYDECDVYQPTFIAANKAVFHIEYTDEATFPDVCATTVPLGLSSILKEYDLTAYRVGCGP